MAEHFLGDASVFSDGPVRNGAKPYPSGCSNHFLNTTLRYPIMLNEIDFSFVRDITWA